MRKLQKQTIKVHLQELKLRVLYCILFFLVIWSVAFCYADFIYNIIALPLLAIDPNIAMIYTALGEGFTTHLKVAGYSAIGISLPYWLWHLYLFISPGLYQHERQIIRICFILAPVLFVSGVLLLYYIAMPMIWQFFTSFQTSAETGVPIVLQAKISEYLTLFLELSLAFGFSFQLPVLAVILSRLGIINPKWLQTKRRYAIVAIFIIAAILTPPDVISQITLALPLLLLYEISIILVKIVNKNNKPPCTTLN
jgi:sec-independent protein translocase protein TatC